MPLVDSFMEDERVHRQNLADAINRIGTTSLSLGTPLVLNPYAANVITTQAHGMGLRPTFFVVDFECSVADAGYSAGDIINMTQLGPIGGGAISWTITSDTTNTQLNTTSGVTPAVPNKGTNTNTSITPGSWKITVYPYRSG